MALLAIVAAAAALRARGVSHVVGPWIQVDETIYAKLGVSLWRDGTLDVLGGPTGFYSLVYPAFAGIPLAIGGVREGAEALRILQAVVVALTAVPVYLWARALAPRRLALIAAALSVVPAGLAYSGMVMTEALFYPLLLLAAWAITRALERPGRGRAAVAVALVLVCCATRLQAVVLIPAVVTAAGLLALAERRWAPLARIAAPAGELAAAAVAWIAWRTAAGRPLLGSYDAATESRYEAGAVLRYIGYHVADTVLLSGVVPALAVALLAVAVLRGRETSPTVRAYTVTAVSVSAWVIVQVGAFASVHVTYLAERNIFSLAPVLFVGLAAWLARGAPRPWLTTAAIGAAAVGLCATLPLGRLLGPAALPYAPSSIAAWQALDGLATETQQAVLLAAVGGLAVLLAVLPRRALVVLPAIALVALAAASVQATRYIAAQSALQQVRFLGPEPRWIDRVATGPVTYVYDGDRDWDAVWANLFWNERIDEVVVLPGTRVIGAVPQHEVAYGPDGRFRALPAAMPGRGGPAGDAARDGDGPRYAVVASKYELLGSPVADAPQQLPGQAGLRLWLLDGPLRMSTTRAGLEPNGDIYGGGEGSLTAYRCQRGSFRATVISKQEQTLDVLRDGIPYRRISLSNGEIWRGSIPAPPARTPAARSGRRSCTFSLRPAGLVGTTLFMFERR